MEFTFRRFVLRRVERLTTTASCTARHSRSPNSHAMCRKRKDAISFLLFPFSRSARRSKCPTQILSRYRQKRPAQNHHSTPTSKRLSSPFSRQIQSTEYRGIGLLNSLTLRHSLMVRTRITGRNSGGLMGEGLIGVVSSVSPLSLSLPYTN